MGADLDNLIISLEIELLRPEVRTSLARLTELIADDFVELGQSDQRYTKPDLLRLLPGHPGTSFHATDFELKPLGPDAVLLTYRVEAVIADGRESSRSWRSSIWQRRAGRWQIVFHQGTSVNLH